MHKQFTSFFSWLFAGVILLLYNLLLPILVLLALFPWLLKTIRRKGLSWQLFEKIGFLPSYKKHYTPLYYLHAVSVGEVGIALKLITLWHQKIPQAQFIIATGTSTGLAIAKNHSKKHAFIHAHYAPLDIPPCLFLAFHQIQPTQVVLIEAEAWPNLLSICQVKKIPTSLVNARLSERSFQRFLMVRRLISPFFNLLRVICLQEEEDKARFKQLLIDPSKLSLTGSIKFDPSTDTLPPPLSKKKDHLLHLLLTHPKKNPRPIILLASTHPREEKKILSALNDLPALFIIAPRHVERMRDVLQDIRNIQYTPLLLSKALTMHTQDIIQWCQDNPKTCLCIDSTGELASWTAKASIAIIGKSWEAHGGQTPIEAILAKVCVITGPYMENFEPLIAQLEQAKGILKLSDYASLQKKMHFVLENPEQKANLEKTALLFLQKHANATSRTLDIISHYG